MNTHLTQAELAQLDASLLSAINLSMLDGYLAAVASGPNFVMPDQILHWGWAAGEPADQDIVNLIIRHYQTVNDALNVQTDVPNLTDPQAWCCGYLAGFVADMTAWAPLTAARPGLLKVIMSGADTSALADAARQIHAFWVERRRVGADGDGLEGLLAALTPGQTVQPNQRQH
jgi:uncharacterized protein